MRRAFWIPVAVVACRAEPAYDGTSYRCDDGVTCPSGYECRASMCVRTGGAFDAPLADALAGADGATVDGAVDGGPDGPRLDYADVVLADEPILYLPLDDTGDVALDVSGHGRNGSYVGGVTHQDGAALFDGVDDAVVIPDEEALRLNTSFSIEAWVQVVTQVATYPGIVHKGASDVGGTSYIIYYPTNDPEMIFKRATIDVRRTDGAVAAPGTWRHYVVTYDAGAETLRWYVDGQLDITYTGIAYPTNVDTAPLSLGRGDEFGHQILDEVAFYDRTLSEERVRAHFDAR